MATSTAKEIVELKMPDMVGDSRVDDIIVLADFYISSTIFKTKYQYALALVALHMLMLDKQSGGSSTSSGSGSVGGIKSDKEGDLARSFGGVGSNVSERNQYFMSTPFGQELLQLWKACLILPRNRFVSGG